MNHDTEQLWWRAFVSPASHTVYQNVAGLCFVPICCTTPLDSSCSAEVFLRTYMGGIMGEAMANIICYHKGNLAAQH